MTSTTQQNKSEKNTKTRTRTRRGPFRLLDWTCKLAKVPPSRFAVYINTQQQKPKCAEKEREQSTDSQRARRARKMGAGALPATANPAAREAPLVLGLQASALVDHVARVDWSLLDQLPGERGGSIPVNPF